MAADTNEEREFAIRYHRWGLEQWRLEIEQHFPLLRAISGATAMAALRILDRLPPEKCLALGEALAAAAGAKRLGEPVSPEAERLVRVFGEHLWREGLAGHFVLNRTGIKLSPGAKKTLQAEVQKAVEPVLGSEKRRSDVSTWTYSTSIGPWIVETGIETKAGPEWHLAYDHTVYLSGQRVAWMISAQDWLHITSCTQWTLTSEQEIPATVAGLAMVCRRFLDAAPVLLP
jgi:hypothetical protein